MKNTTIAFIGGGNMATSLIGGLIADGFDANKIWVADPDGEKLHRLAAQFPVQTTTDNVHAVKQAEIVVLAVKPQNIKQACDDIAVTLQAKNALLISIAAGIRKSALRAWLGTDVPLVRTMPNTPALIQSGATVLCADSGVSHAQRSLAESLMRSVGVTLWIEDESQMDAVTALSGSGPAYFFYVMEVMEQAAVELGLTQETAHLLTLQTAFGAAKMALESTDDIAQLRARVTSPGGTTERAISVLQHAQIKRIFAEALSAAQQRSQELAEILERQS